MEVAMTKDERLIAIFTAAMIAAIIALATCSAVNMAGAKELPLLLHVSELGEAYDNQRVVVMGWERSMAVKRGRMGSHYVSATVGVGDISVNVFSYFPHINLLNNRVIVQGIYHHSGRFGGIPAERFIVADAIIRDWEED